MSFKIPLTQHPVHGERYAIFASIGPSIPDKKDPIKFTKHIYTPRVVYLIGSDERGLEDRGTTIENMGSIQSELKPLSVKTIFHHLKPDSYNTSVYEVAIDVIIEILSDPSIPVIFDVSAGRVEMSYVLSQAGHIAIEFIHTYTSITPKILVTIKGKDYLPDNRPVIFQLNTPYFPTGRTLDLLSGFKMQEKTEDLSKEYKKDKTTITREFKKLERAGYIETSKIDREFTEGGQFFKTFIDNCVSQIKEERLLDKITKGKLPHLE